MSLKGFCDTCSFYPPDLQTNVKPKRRPHISHIFILLILREKKIIPLLVFCPRTHYSNSLLLEKYLRGVINTKTIFQHDISLFILKTQQFKFLSITEHFEMMMSQSSKIHYDVGKMSHSPWYILIYQADKLSRPPEKG